MYEIFMKLLQEKGVTAYQVAKATGISNSTLSEWKKGKIAPKADKIKLLADYFGVSVDYLLGKEPTDDNSPKLPDIMYRFTELSEDKQKEVVAFMEFKLHQQEDA